MALVARDIALRKQGPTFSLRLEPGQTLCVVGPAASGKSKLLRVLAGVETPERGEVSGAAGVALPEPCNRKIRPQDLSHKKGENRANLATEVLSHLGLWDVRQQTISDLAPGQIAACDLVATFMGAGDPIVLDEHLDRLDPWIRTAAMNLIRERGVTGVITLLATNHLELAALCDLLVVMKDYQPVYAGPVAELAAKRGQRSLTIESERNVGVRALVEPLLVGVAVTDSGYKLQPGPGQEQTARLLREGYGDLKYIVSDQKPLAEIILSMV